MIDEIRNSKQSFHYEVNGLKLRLAVSPEGFTLWDEIEQQWIIDASTLADNGVVNVANPGVLKGVLLEREPQYPGERSFEVSVKALKADAHGNDNGVPFCDEHEIPMELTDYDDESRYECPECKREDGEQLGLM